MAMLKFNKGLLEGLKTKAISEGNVYITTDERAMYVDIDNSTRIRIGQIVEKTSSEWENLPQPYDVHTYYYITDINALVRWNGTKWVQINGTAGIKADVETLKSDVSTAKTNITNLQTDLDKLEETVQGIITVGGQANVIEEITVGGTKVDPVNKSVALGKFAAVDKTTIAESDIDDAFSTKLGTMSQNITTLQTDVNTLKGDNATVGSVAHSIKSALGTFETEKIDPIATKANNNETAIGNINTTIGSVSYTGDSITAAIKQLQTDVNTNGQNITKLDTRIGTAEGKITALETNLGTAQGDITTLKQAVESLGGEGAGSVTEAKEAAKAAQDTADEALEKAGTNATNIANLNTALNEVKENYLTKAAFNTEKETLNTAIQAADGKGQQGINDAKAAQDDVDALEKIVGTGISGTTLTDKLTTVEQNFNTLQTQVGNVTNLMNFRGVATRSDLSDITEPKIGDVAIYGNKEYVYATVDNTNKWVEYGDASVNAAEITALDERLDTAESKITALEGTVGDTTKGLVKQVNDNASNINTLSTNLTNNYYTKTQIDTYLSWGSF